MTEKYTNRPFAPTHTVVFGQPLPLSVPYFNDDAPYSAYSNNDLAFVAQPMGSPQNNEDRNVTPVPLIMTDEWNIIRDSPDIIDSLRNTEKKHDFMFIGQCGYAGREVFRTLNLDNYRFEETEPVYGLQGEEKTKTLIKFLEATAESRFVFAPRGIGSSSFRAYQSLMVGSVPIITGMNDYPFKDVIDWDTFCLSGSLEDLPKLIKQASTIDYDSFVEVGKQFWDDYCHPERLHSKLSAIAIEDHFLTNHRDNLWGLGAD